VILAGNEDSARGESIPLILGFRPKRVTDEMVTTIHTAFPDIPRDNIQYDLLKTGDVEVTSNKIIEKGFLEPPPAAFYRAFPRQDDQQQANSTASQSSASSSKTQGPSLIQRYQLEKRLDESVANSSPSNAAAWEDSAEKREASLRERKAKMILEARARMAAPQSS